MNNKDSGADVAARPRGEWKGDLPPGAAPNDGLELQRSSLKAKLGTNGDQNRILKGATDAQVKQRRSRGGSKKTSTLSQEHSGSKSSEEEPTHQTIKVHEEATNSDSPYKISKLPSLYRQRDQSLNMVIFKEEVSSRLKPLLAAPEEQPPT